MGCTATAVENLALRQQVAVFKQSVQTAEAASPRPHLLGRAFPPLARLALCPGHRPARNGHQMAPEGIRLYWKRKSGAGKPGRPPIKRKIRNLIRRMSRENPTWGAPRIVSELALLGHDIVEATVAKYMVRTRKPPSQTWRTFLDNHVTDIAACDFFTVPTVNFRVLYVFIVLRHDRRQIVHFNITTNPYAEWTAQQIINALPV